MNAPKISKQIRLGLKLAAFHPRHGSADSASRPVGCFQKGDPFLDSRMEDYSTVTHLGKGSDEHGCGF